MKVILTNTANIKYSFDKKGKCFIFYGLDTKYISILMKTLYSFKEVKEKQGYKININIKRYSDLVGLRLLLGHDLIVTDKMHKLPVLEIYDDWRE